MALLHSIYEGSLPKPTDLPQMYELVAHLSIFALLFAFVESISSPSFILVTLTLPVPSEDNHHRLDIDFLFALAFAFHDLLASIVIRLAEVLLNMGRMYAAKVEIVTK